MSDSDGFDASESEKEAIPEDVQAARQQWTEIEQQQQELQQLPSHAGVGGVTVDRGYFMTFFDSRAYLIEQTDTVQCNVPPLAQAPPRCCCIFQKRNTVECEAWEKIYKISRITFDENDVTHHRILNSLNTLITGVRTAPPRRGPHWQTIGFQNTDPITDLRATGMLGLLLPMQLFAKFEALGKKLIARSREVELPMMVALIRYVKTTLDALGTTQILSGCTSVFECWDVMGRFFAGMVSELCELAPLGIIDSSNESPWHIEEVAAHAMARPIATVRRGREEEEKSVDRPALRAQLPLDA